MRKDVNRNDDWLISTVEWEEEREKNREQEKGMNGVQLGFRWWL